MDERDLKFFRPVWRRVVVIALLTAWTTAEWLAGNSFWGTFTTGALGVSIWISICSFRQNRTGKSDS